MGREDIKKQSKKRDTLGNTILDDPEIQELPTVETLNDEATLAAFQSRKDAERKELIRQLEKFEPPAILKKRKKHPFLRLLVIIGVIVGIALFLRSNFFSIKTISVEGNHYYTAEEVIDIGDVKTGGNIFWGIGKGRIKKRLLNNVYFEDVTIKRKLPNEIVVVVKEKKQIAAFVYGDEYVIIDNDATVLRKSEVAPKLTLLTGLNISKIKVGEKIEAVQKDRLKSMLTMLETMEKGDLYFKRIDISQNVIKAYISDTLVCKGTTKQLVTNIENGNLQKVVNNLIKTNVNQGTISLGNHDFISYSSEISN